MDVAVAIDASTLDTSGRADSPALPPDAPAADTSRTDAFHADTFHADTLRPDTFHADTLGVDVGPCGPTGVDCLIYGCTPRALNEYDCNGKGACPAGDLCASTCESPPYPSTFGNGGYPALVTTDANNVYWVYTSAYNTQGYLMQANKAGSAKQLWVTDGLLSIAVDSKNVYFVSGNAASGSISSCPIGGCQSASPAGTPTTVVSSPVDAKVMRALASDGTNVYWANYSSGTVYSCPIVGCATPTQIGSGETNPQNLTLQGSQLYWVQGNSVMTAPTNGTASVFHGGSTTMVDVAVDSLFVYWTDGSSVFREPIGGGTIDTLDGPESYAITGVWVDPVGVYWQTLDAVYKLPLCGGPVVTMFNQPGFNLAHIATDAATLYLGTSTGLQLEAMPK
jgi:hypothetical protein